jgi:hypothetical protein
MLKLVTARNYFRVHGLLSSGSQLARCSTYITAGQTPMKTPTMSKCFLFGLFWFCCWATTVWWCFLFGPFRGCYQRSRKIIHFSCSFVFRESWATPRILASGDIIRICHYQIKYCYFYWEKWILGDSIACIYFQCCLRCTLPVRCVLPPFLSAQVSNCWVRDRATNHRLRSAVKSNISF